MLLNTVQAQNSLTQQIIICVKISVLMRLRTLVWYEKFNMSISYKNVDTVKKSKG